MSEISFQAMQFTPRFVSVVVLLALTWLVAKFVQYMIQRATGECQSQDGRRRSFSLFISRITFWAVFLIMFPFIVNAAGVSALWLQTMLHFVGQLLDVS